MRFVFAYVRLFPSLSLSQLFGNLCTQSDLLLRGKSALR